MKSQKMNILIYALINILSSIVMLSHDNFLRGIYFLSFADDKWFGYLVLVLGIFTFSSIFLKRCTYRKIALVLQGAFSLIVASAYSLLYLEGFHNLTFVFAYGYFMSVLLTSFREGEAHE